MMRRLIRAKQHGTRSRAIASIYTDFDTASGGLFGNDRNHSAFDEEHVHDRGVWNRENKVAMQVDRHQVLGQGGKIFCGKMSQQAIADIGLIKHGEHTSKGWH